MPVKKPQKAGPRKEPRRRPSAKASAKNPSTRKKRPTGAEPKVAPRDRAASLELRLRKTVAELGLTEARKIFASVEAAFGDIPGPHND